MEPVEVTSYKLVYEDRFVEKEIVSYKPVMQERLEKRQYTVRKPVTETATVNETYTVMKPFTRPITSIRAISKRVRYRDFAARRDLHILSPGH